jgi:hypothetical protein
MASLQRSDPLLMVHESCVFSEAEALLTEYFGWSLCRISWLSREVSDTHGDAKNN